MYTDNDYTNDVISNLTSDYFWETSDLMFHYFYIKSIFTVTTKHNSIRLHKIIHSYIYIYSIGDPQYYINVIDTQETFHYLGCFSESYVF